MPIYEYRRPDGSTFELMQSFADDPLTHDPETGLEVRRVLHAPAVHFKGKGFYNTDYGTRKRQRENAASADGSSSGSDGASSTSDGASPGKDGAGAGKEGSSSEGKGAAGESKPKGETSSAKGSKSKPVAATS
jgi:putative FmdB family regulatory protein